MYFPLSQSFHKDVSAKSQTRIATRYASTIFANQDTKKQITFATKIVYDANNSMNHSLPFSFPFHV